MAAKKQYRKVPLSEIVGKTVESVRSSYVMGAYGREPMTVIRFTDGTRHAFVHPSED